MSMLTLNGQIINVFDTPESTDRKTGEIRAAKFRIRSSHPSPSFRCSVCGALATFPEYLICWSCAEWAQDLRESFSLRSSTSLPTGGKIQIEEPSLSGAVSSIFFVGAV